MHATSYYESQIECTCTFICTPHYNPSCGWIHRFAVFIQWKMGDSHNGTRDLYMTIIVSSSSLTATTTYANRLDWMLNLDVSRVILGFNDINGNILIFARFYVRAENLILLLRIVITSRWFLFMPMFSVYLSFYEYVCKWTKSAIKE